MGLIGFDFNMRNNLFKEKQKNTYLYQIIAQFINWKRLPLFDER